MKRLILPGFLLLIMVSVGFILQGKAVAPALTATTLDGETIALAQWRGAPYYIEF